MSMQLSYWLIKLTVLKNHFTEDILIDLWKTFDIADHIISIDKIENYSVKKKLYNGFKAIQKSQTVHIVQQLKCIFYTYLMWCSPSFNAGTISISSPYKWLSKCILIFRSYNVSRQKKSFLYISKYIVTLFSTVNIELDKISQWFRTNKLSVNI